MNPNKMIPFSLSHEKVDLIFNEVSERSDSTVCIEGRQFRVYCSGDNPVRIKQIQDKISKLVPKQNLTIKEFFFNVLNCQESTLSDKNLEIINSLQSSILSVSDRKKGESEYAARSDMISQTRLYSELMTSLEEKEISVKKLSEESFNLRSTAYGPGQSDLIDSIRSIAASILLPQVEAQYKEHRIELMELKFKLHQLLPATTAEEKLQSSKRLDSILVDAICTEHIAYTHQLIKAGAELKDSHLFAAVIADSAKLIDILVKEGCNPNAKGHSSSLSLLGVACLRGRNASKAIEALVHHGADLTSLDDSGNAPINYAVRSDLDEKKVIALLKKLQKPNFQDGKGSSLLHEAITRISFEWGNTPFEYLLNVQKATPNVKDARGSTPLHHAIERLKENSLPVVLQLIEKGAIATALDNQGQTPLHIAARISNEISQVGKKDKGSVVQALIKGGAAPNVTDLNGRTALHEAVRYGFDATNLRSIEELIKGGVDLDIQDIDGNTALHLAVAGEHVSLVELLLKHGANRNLRDNTGRLPGAAGFVISKERRQKILDLLAKL